MTTEEARPSLPAPDLGHPLAGVERNAPFGAIALEKSRQRLIGEAGPDAGFGLDDVHLDAHQRQGGGDLHADEPGPDDDRPLVRTRLGRDPLRVLEGPQGVNPFEIAPGDHQGDGSSPGRDESLLEPDLLAARDLRCLGRRIETLDGGAEDKVDPLVDVHLLGIEEELFLLLLAAQELFGQGRPVVRRRGLLAHQRDGGVRVLVPKLLGRPVGSQTGADEEMFGGFHGTSKVQSIIHRLHR